MPQEPRSGFKISRRKKIKGKKNFMFKSFAFRVFQCLYNFSAPLLKYDEIIIEFAQKEVGVLNLIKTRKLTYVQTTFSLRLTLGKMKQ